MIFLYCFIFLILFFAINIILSQNTVNSILSLILIFFLSSLILLFFGLDYLSLIFISIYVGALSVLFLFVIMMLNIKNFYSTSNLLFYLILSIFIFIFFYIQYLKLKYNFILKYNNLDFYFIDIALKKNIIYVIGFYLFTNF